MRRLTTVSGGEGHCEGLRHQHRSCSSKKGRNPGAMPTGISVSLITEAGRCTKMGLALKEAQSKFCAVGSGIVLCTAKGGKIG